MLVVDFPPLINFDHIIVSGSTNFPSNSKENPSFHFTAFHYFCTDWDGLHDHLKDAPCEDIFKVSASTDAAKFCE